MDKAGSLTLPAQNDSYAFDALDNRTRRTVNGIDQYAIFDAANQLVELRSGSPTGALTHAFVYDANGNLIQKCEGTGVSRTPTTCSGSTVSTFAWDPDDRLIQANMPGATETYQYDHLGRRISKTSNGVTTNYRYNGDDIDAEYSATWSETARYVHGPNTDDPLMRLTGQTNDPSATAVYYHQDGINSVVATSDQSGNIVAAQLFDAWGNRVQSTGSIAQYGYTGREPDQSGMIYYRARYYDPTLGRFISRDPAGMPNGVNRYAYVNNNPVNLTDPTGLYAKQYNTNSNTANINYTADLSSFGQTYSSGSYNLGSNQSSAAPLEQNPFAPQKCVECVKVAGDVTIDNAMRAAGLQPINPAPVSTSKSANFSMNIPLPIRNIPTGINISGKITGWHLDSLFIGGGLVVNSSFSVIPRASGQASATQGSTSSGFASKVSVSAPFPGAPRTMLGTFGFTGSYSLQSRSSSISGGPGFVGGRPSASATWGYNFKF